MPDAGSRLSRLFSLGLTFLICKVGHLIALNLQLCREDAGAKGSAALTCSTRKGLSRERQPVSAGNLRICVERRPPPPPAAPICEQGTVGAGSPPAARTLTPSTDKAPLASGGPRGGGGGRGPELTPTRPASAADTEAPGSGAAHLPKQGPALRPGPPRPHAAAARPEAETRAPASGRAPAT